MDRFLNERLREARFIAGMGARHRFSNLLNEVDGILTRYDRDGHGPGGK